MFSIIIHVVPMCNARVLDNRSVPIDRPSASARITRVAFIRSIGEILSWYITNYNVILAVCHNLIIIIVVVLSRSALTQ